VAPPLSVDAPKSSRPSMQKIKRKASIVALAVAIGYVFANTHRDRGGLTNRLHYNTEGPAD
jgi:hypothetical protein